MPSIKRLHQIFGMPELQDGEAISATNLFTDTNADALVIEPAMVFEPELFDRSNINRPSVSPLQPLAGVTPGSFTFQMELAGSTDLTPSEETTGIARPPFSHYLVCAGTRRRNLMKYTLTSVLEKTTGDPAMAWQGTIFTQAGHTSTLVLAKTVRTGDTEAWFCLQDGDLSDLDHDVLTAVSGSPICEITPAGTPSSVHPDLTGHAWFPASLGELEITLAATAAVTGSVGDVVEGATSTAVAVVMKDFTTSDTKILVRRLDLFFDVPPNASAEVIRFSGAGATIGTTASVRQIHSVHGMSMGIIEDSRRRQLHGARGSYAIAAEIGQAGLFTFNYKGLITEASIRDAGPIGGVAYTQRVPPVFLNIELSAGDDTIDTSALVPSVRLQSFSFDHGSTVEIPRDMTEAQGLYDAAHIVGRDSTGSLNVSVAPESVYDFLRVFAAGEAINVTITATDAAGYEYSIGASCILSSESGGDQNGFATTDFSLKLASRAVGNQDIDDAEIVIAYNTTL